MKTVKLVIVSAMLLMLSIYLFGCGSPMLTGAKTALQETPPNWERAEKNVKLALVDTPNDWEAHMYMAIIDNHFGRYENATTEYQKAKELAAGNEAALKTIDRRRFENAVKLMAQDKYDIAAKEVETIGMDVAESSSELYNIGLLYLKLAKAKEDDEAGKKEYLGKAVEAFSKTVEMAQHEVELAEGNKKLSNESIMQIRTDAATTYSGLAMAQSAAGNHEGAIEAYENGLKLDPENAELKEKLMTARLEMGVMYIDEGKFDDAINYYKGLMDKDPEYTDVYYFIGKTYIKKSNALKDAGDEQSAKAAQQEALTYFNQYLELNPGDAETLDELYRIYMRNDEFAQAKTMAEKMTALYPEKATEFVFVYLGQACQQLEDYECARNAFDKYMEAKPDDVMGYHLKAAVFTKMATAAEEAGDTDKAAEYQGEAAKLFEQAGKLQEEQGGE